MKKTKRILALLCAIGLILMYLLTLIFALFDRSEAMGLLKASIACTIILPVLLYGYMLVYRLAHKTEKDSDSSDTL